MKTTFVLLCVLIAFIQASSSEPTEVTRQINAALGECVTKLNLKKDDVIEEMKQNVIPEGDANTIKFFGCFSKELGLVNDAGDTDFEKLLPIVKDMIKQRLGNVEDVDAKAQRIASAAIDQCKATPKAEDPGLTTLKIRNCIRGVSIKPQTL